MKQRGEEGDASEGAFARLVAEDSLGGPRTKESADQGDGVEGTFVDSRAAASRGALVPAEEGKRDNACGGVGEGGEQPGGIREPVQGSVSRGRSCVTAIVW